MGFDFVESLVFPILQIQFFTFHIESERITVYPVNIIFPAGNQPTVFIKDWFIGVFVILEHEIPLGFSVISIFTRYVLQDCHENIPRIYFSVTVQWK